mmetsp:Transcript_31995/g.73575  ORF Transcript_31995/g.73575 Transcript_31995/m.73575 type:complete len:86 (+) Transcript_31995:1390-1647(+)
MTFVVSQLQSTIGVFSFRRTGVSKCERYGKPCRASPWHAKEMENGALLVEHRHVLAGDASVSETGVLIFFHVSLLKWRNALFFVG